MSEIDDARQLRLSHHHLAFFFLGAVVVCAIFFALGFVVGRGQTYEAAVKEQPHIGKGPELTSDSNAGSSLSQGPENRKGGLVRGQGQNPDYHRELDFYNTLDEKGTSENFHPDRQKARKQDLELVAKPNVPSTPQAPSKVPRGNLVSLQVGAYGSPVEADRLAKALRSKGYSVSLLKPGIANGDKLIRIHVGPFAQVEEANKVKAQLEKDGYQVIVKR
jgi:hypothetical protein